MSIIQNLFGFSDKSNNPKVEWKQLTHLNQLDSIEQESNEMPIVIFKHSTLCGISRMVLRNFENDFDSNGEILPYFLDLLQQRDISNEIADRFDVRHQSPQIIVIKDGKAVYDASHESIDAAVLKNI